MAVSDDMLSRVVERLEDAPPDDADAVLAARLAARAEQRSELGRMQARRKRMAALMRGVRDPARHGALRQAVLRLDAMIAALERSLAPAE